MSDSFVQVVELPGSIGSWVEGEFVRVGEILSPEVLAARMGDFVFLDNGDIGLLQHSWGHRELFGFLYGGDVRVKAFGEVKANGEWRRHWLHRKALDRAVVLRQEWAGFWNRMARATIVSWDDGEWSRRLSREHVDAITSAVGQPEWSALGVKLPLDTGLAATIDKARGSIEKKFHALYVLRSTYQYLREFGITEGLEMDKSRKGLMRAMGRFWQWARNGEKTVTAQGRLTGLEVEIPSFKSGTGEVTKRVVEVVGARALARASKILSGKDRVALVVSYVAQFFEKLTLALSSHQPLDTELFIVVTSLGLIVRDGQLTGRLNRRWRNIMASAICDRMGRESHDAPLVSDTKRIVSTVAEKFFMELSLMEPEALKREGREAKVPLVDRVERVAIEGMFTDAFRQQGIVTNFKRSPIGTISGGNSQRTVYRSIFLEKTPEEARSFWTGMEKTKGSFLVTQSVGDLRLPAIVDGMARAYLELVGMGVDRYGKSPVGVGADFWAGVKPAKAGEPEVSAPVSPGKVWVMGDAALASQVWALSQLLGASASQESLGLSGGYTRRLRQVFSLMIPVVGYHRSRTWMYGGRDLLAGVNQSGGLGMKVLRSMAPGYDTLFCRRPAEPPTFKVAGVDVPTVVQIPGDLPAGMQPHSVEYALQVPRSRVEVTTKGFFRKSPSGNWVFAPDGTGAIVPGLEHEWLARSYSLLTGLFAEQANMHPRAMMVAILEAAHRGKFPEELWLLTPVGFAGWPPYIIKGVLPCSGLSAVDLVWRRSATQMPIDHMAALANFDTPVWVGEDYDRELSALTSGFNTVSGAMWGIWQGVLDRPSVARLGMFELSQVVYVARVLMNLRRGVHPMTLISFAAGGGCPQGAEEWTRKVWGPMFKSCRVPARAGEAIELASGLEKMAKLIAARLGEEVE